MSFKSLWLTGATEEQDDNIVKYSITLFTEANMNPKPATGISAVDKAV